MLIILMKGANMLTLGQLNENKVVTIHVQGKLTKTDYERVLPDLEIMMNEHGVLKFYIKLEDFSGFDMDALWEDIKFDYKQQKQYGKIAIVGQKQWEEWGVKLSDLFFKSEVKFFYEEQAEQAWQWIN